MTQYDETAKTPAQQVEEKNRHTTNALRTVSYEELKARPKPVWAIDGIQQAKGLGLIHGEPGTYKTFLMLDMCQASATGMKDWAGHKIDRPRKVLYILAEGIDFLIDRLDAWLTLHDNIDLDEFNESVRFYPGAVNILDENDVQAVISTAKAWGCETIIFDTYSRMITGQNENDNGVASLAVSNLDTIARQISGWVWIVHHNSKAGDFRGSTVVNGALDMRIEAVKGDAGTVILNCKKAKNTSDFAPIRFEMRDVGPSVVPVPASAVGWVGSTVPAGLNGSFNRDTAPF